MKSLTITTSKATILVVELPKFARGVSLFKTLIGWTESRTYTPEYYGLPEGEWELLGKANQLTEEQAERTCYPEPVYIGDVLGHHTHLNSLHSLLRANGAGESNYILIKK